MLIHGAKHSLWEKILGEPLAGNSASLSWHWNFALHSKILKLCKRWCDSIDTALIYFSWGIFSLNFAAGSDLEIEKFWPDWVLWKIMKKRFFPIFNLSPDLWAESIRDQYSYDFGCQYMVRSTLCERKSLVSLWLEFQPLWADIGILPQTEKFLSCVKYDLILLVDLHIYF